MKRKIKIIRGVGDVNLLLRLLKEKYNFDNEKLENIKENLIKYFEIYKEFAIDINTGDIVCAINNYNNLLLGFYEYDIF